MGAGWPGDMAGRGLAVKVCQVWTLLAIVLLTVVLGIFRAKKKEIKCTVESLIKDKPFNHI